MLFLFQGDSITDCNRSRLKHHDLGEGYVNLINHYIEIHLRHLRITCLNQGVSGNRSHDLCERWEKDCLDLQPDLLSILVGINDTWRHFDLHLLTSPEEFRANYTYLLDSIRLVNPDIKLVLMSPFLLPVESGQLEWFEDLNTKIQIIKELALSYNAIYIPLQEIFNDHISLEKPNIYWTDDGVHPNAKGHVLIAKTWIEAALKPYLSSLEGVTHEPNHTIKGT